MKNVDMNSSENLNVKQLINLKEQKLAECDFEIPDYIIDEFVNSNNYNNLCSLINLAVANNRISVENGEYLKYKGYELFNGKTNYK